MSVKKNLFLFSQFVVLLFMLFSCTNFFHNIIPPDDKDIINFQVEYKNGSRSVAQTPDKNNIITITVPTDTDITSLIPIVNISEKAEIIPGTLPYLMQMFPDRDIMSLAVEMQKAQIQGNFINWFVNLILQNEGFKIPKLETPIDFTMPVSFYVISGQGNYKVYTVKVVRENVGVSELNPYDPTKTEKKILSFTVENQIGETKIDNINNSVEFELPPEVNIKSILPNIQVSEGAKPLPLVQNYLLECGFTFTQIIDFCTGYSTTTDVNRYISIYLQKNNNLVIPDISIPIDFSSEIEIAVIAGDRSANIYSVNTIVNESLPFISEFSFGKTKNPYLVKDAKILIGSQDINAELLYPMEMELNYSLIPDFVFIGDKVTYKMGSAPEVEIISGQTSIPFDIIIDSCTLIVYAGTNFIEYNLNLYREEDPDSIRSITDYRFKKNKNSSIKENVVASIYNEGDLGLITGTILYEGDIAPYELIPEFITPGTVTLNGVNQISGTTKNSFEYSADYLCTSKNGLYCRVYTIKFDFIKVEPAVAIIKNFSFPDYLNSGITQSAQGIIDEVTNTIRVEVEYYGNEIPYDLIPQFSATGPVYISNLEQTSGFSRQNFRYSKYYTVKSSEDSSVSKIYKVEVVFTPDPTSACEILSFGFLKTDNPSLTKNVEAKISQRDLSIFALMPYGSGAKEGTKLIPYFTVKGNVTVDGITQISGVNAQDFSNEIIYTVTSENGYNQKQYKITLQESGDVIYVDINAVGRNNGTSWKDAYIDLNLALDQAALLPAEASAEIWITAPQDKVYYSTSSYGFKLDKEGSITILGGFNGTEENSTDREFDDKGNLVNRTKIEPSSSSNGLFLCNDLIKDYVHIEGIESNKTIKSFFMTWIYGTGYVKSFEKSNITINDSKFTTGNYSNQSIASSGYDNTYKVKIINSEFTSLLDESSEENTFHIENCNAITKYQSYIELKGSNIIFNNNTIPGGYAKISLKSTGKLEFENNIASKPDSVIITSTETYTGIETEIDEPVWYLSLQGECDLTLENMTFASLYANSGVNAEINNCKFIKANIADYSSPTPDLYLYSNSNITVNDSTFTNRRIYQSSNSSLTLNNCDVAIGNDAGLVNINSYGDLSINEGSYKLKTIDANNFYIKGNLNINGGFFNINHSGEYASFYVECDAIISNAKFSFTGDNNNNSSSICFQGADYISKITNSEFIINAKTYHGFSTEQKDLSINESNIDINISYETSRCYGFYGSGIFTITDSTLDIKSSSTEYYSYGIYGNTEFSITDSTLDITSSSDDLESYGIYGYSSFTITDSNLGIITSSNRSWVSCGIYGNSDFGITGSNVEINTSSVKNHSYGIYGKTEFTITDSTLDITSSSTGSYSYGIYGKTEFTITDSTLDITSTSSESYSYGIYGYSSFTITDSTLDIKSSSTESYSYCIRVGDILSIEESDVTVTSTSTSSTSYGIYSNLSSKNTNYTINAEYGIYSTNSESKIEGGKINISYAGTSGGIGIYCSNIKSAEISVIHKLVDDYYNASTIGQMQNALNKLVSVTGSYIGIACDILEDCTIKKIMTHHYYGIITGKIINTKITTASKSIFGNSFMHASYLENCNINIEPDSDYGITANDLTIKGGTYTIKTINNNGSGISATGTINISGATFKNSVSKAPCIYLNSSNINIKDSTFSGCKNEAPSSIFNHRGGALGIILSGGSCKISKCTFKNNKIVNKSNEALALAQGGAGLAVSIRANNVTLHVTNCTFDGNDADGKANGHHFWASNNWTTGEKFDGCNYSESGTTYTNPKDGQQGIIN